MGLTEAPFPIYHMYDVMLGCHRSCGTELLTLNGLVVMVWWCGSVTGIRKTELELGELGTD